MQGNKDDHRIFRNLKLILLLCFVSATGAFAQITVTGIITDANGEILPGVNILVKASTTGAITDVEGSYSITVQDSDAILVFSYIGYTPQEIPVGNNTTLDVVLVEDVMAIDELVVVAYGTQKKSHLTGAVSSLKSEGLDEIPVARADQALQGQLAGVQVLNFSPEAGEAPIIRVRGMGSISAGNEPLIVVDGYPVPDGLSMVNMSDVETIEVLKDASSSALYGSRAAGGVILVTTKSGSENKTRYNFKMYAGISTPLKLPDMMSTEEYTELLYEESLLREQDPAVDGTVNTMEFFQITNPEKIGYLISKYVVDEPTDWVDEALRDYGKMSNFQLSAAGGDDKKKFYLSAGYTAEDAIMKNSSYDKFSLKTKVDFKLGDRVTVGVNFNPTYSRQERPRVNLTDYMRFKSWMPIRHNEATAALTNKVAGDYAQVSDFSARTYSGVGVDGSVWNMVAENPWTSGNQNPVSIRERTDRIYDLYRMQLNTYIAVDILPGLQFKTSNGAYLSYREYNMKEQTEAYKAGNPNKLTRETTSYSDLLSENILTYDKDLGDHYFNAILGFTVQSTSDKFNRIVGTGFPDEERLSFNMASDILMDSNASDGVTSYYYSEALMSVLGRVMYSYKGKYLLSASLRADGSSKFAEGHKWGTFPSGSIGWRISEEDFMQDSRTISNLKLRASYGLTGNNNIPQYSYMNTVNTLNYVTGTGTGNLVSGMSSNSVSLGNDEITWEQLGETNLGLDLGFVRNRYTLSVEAYNSNTIQLLLRQPAMYITGHQSFWNNIGEVNNRGIELELKATVISKRDFSWNITANFSTNKNELLNYGELDSGEGDNETNYEDNYGERAEVYRAQVGEESIQYFGYKSNGVYTTFEEVEEALNMTDENGDPFVWTKFKPIIGGLKVVNTDGNNTLDADDRIVLGSPFPDFTWGLMNYLNYKNFDLSFLLQGSQGGEIVNGNIYYNEQLRENRAYTENRFVSPMFPGDGQTVYSTTTAGNQILLTDYPIEDASYGALRYLTLGYTLPSNIAGSLKISSLRVYFTATNLIYLMGSDFRGVNPEARNTTGTYNNPLIAGYQRGVYPLERTYTFGLDLTF